ncbi:trypsin-like peptidase domain-containing protein [Dactylosporangium roseum]|uniref:Trypsin-like peptidase domain-containing protein n=1 Tax=Dactylosporangium roseum TaxID=47989 RepID=A0ABY5YWK7_9ACTN|nr:serine protease [Dactylosporangium roseum]UWZ34146.1 trypsin-like peptidase domain-containing protein [Dactylosporangium roseum]
MDALPGSLRAELITRLAQAYTGRTELELALLAEDVSIDEFSTRFDPPATVLTELFKRGDGAWQRRIAAALVANRPRHEALRSWAAEHGLSAPPDPVGSPAARERTVREGEPRVDVDTYITGLHALPPRVCRIQLVGAQVEPLGTGFLIGPDLCLTNQHVVARVIDGDRRPDEVRLLFDHYVVGNLSRPGVLFELADDWLVASAPSSPVDNLVDPHRVPDPTQADVAVLRVRDRPGETLLTGRDGVTAPRGWFTDRRRDPLPDQASLQILQHAGDEALKTAFGQALGFNGNRTRLRHGINTAPGSSGAPIIDSLRRLVAIHLAGDPDRASGRPARFNVAVPIEAVRVALAGQQVDAEILR